MAMILDNVVPFGRSLDEYQCMFNLSEPDLDKSILGVGDGPASFNAEMHQAEKRVISVDPLYAFDGNEIERQFYKIVDSIISQVEQTPNDWVWSYHDSPTHLRENRIKVLNAFVKDYETGKCEGRYIRGELPDLTIDGLPYDLALCSHFLFLYSEQFDYAFHRAAVFEMLRLAHEVRIFPLLTLGLKRSEHVEPLIAELASNGFDVRVENVKYELQKGGHEMLRVFPK